MSKSQAWSLDIMIAIVIFVGTILLFYFLIAKNESSKIDEMENEALNVMEVVESKNSSAGILDGNEINLTKLETLLGKNYTEIKNKLRLKNEFCIYFEDQNGNILYINGTYLGIGSETINISNIPCG